eukprot:8402286-Pyramimonas_sp.AAC.1
MIQLRKTTQVQIGDRDVKVAHKDPRGSQGEEEQEQEQEQEQEERSYKDSLPFLPSRRRNGPGLQQRTPDAPNTAPPAGVQEAPRRS